MAVSYKIQRLAALLYKPQNRKMGKKAQLIVRKLRYMHKKLKYYRKGGKGGAPAPFMDEPPLLVTHIK